MIQNIYIYNKKNLIWLFVNKQNYLSALHKIYKFFIMYVTIVILIG